MAHAFLEPNRGVDWRAPLPAAAYLSHFGGNFSTSDRLAPLTAEGRETLRRYVELFHRAAPCFAGEVFPVGHQADSLAGPTGIAGIDPATGRRAGVVFGASPEAAAALREHLAGCVDCALRMAAETPAVSEAEWTVLGARVRERLPRERIPLAVAARRRVFWWM